MSLYGDLPPAKEDSRSGAPPPLPRAMLPPAFRKPEIKGSALVCVSVFTHFLSFSCRPTNQNSCTLIFLMGIFFTTPFIFLFVCFNLRAFSFCVLNVVSKLYVRVAY
jgi:hypothetical protein